jgi:internalin A
MSDLDVLRQIEQRIGRSLVRVNAADFEGRARFPNQDVYAMSPDGKVICLSLRGDLLFPGFNRITDFSFLQDLKGLTSLALRSNRITDCSFLKDLKGLTSLDLRSNDITDCSFLKDLKGLTSLDLRSNRITDCSFLKDLKGLTSLALSDNSITDCSFLKDLKGLTSLALSYNSITDCSFLKDLKGLTSLALSDNSITDCLFLKDLKSLTSLDLRHNAIATLPPWITDFDIPIRIDPEFDFNGINLYDNPIETPPEAIVSQGNHAIRNYFAQLATQDKDSLYEAKLLIVGEGEAGKTTLAHKILDPDCALPHIDDRTRGITIQPHYFSVADHTQAERSFQLNVWDFGGQEIYHYTHRFFLTKRSLYLLVADNRRDDTDFNYWLNIIELFADDSPMIIVLNEKDDVTRQINQSDLKGRFAQSLKAISPVNFKTQEEPNPTIRQQRLKAIQALIRQIEIQAQALPHIGEPVPARWLDVRQAIETDPRNHIYREQFEELCHQQTITNPEDIDLLLGYFHDLGIVLHFKDNPLLQHRVILKPTWATQAVYCIFDHPAIKAKQGRFTRQDCTQLWSAPQYRNMQDVLIELMKSFQLVYEIANTGNLVAPQLLPENTPAYPWDAQHNTYMEFRYDLFMPKGILWQLVVELYRYIPNHDWVWRNGVILEREGTRAEIIESLFERRIYLRFVGPRINELRAIVTDALDTLSQTFHKLRYEKMIPCNCSACATTSTPYFYKYSRLRNRLDHKRRTVECEISFDDVSIPPLLAGLGNPPIDPPPQENPSMKTITLFLASSSELEGDRREFEIFIGRKNKELVPKGVYLQLEIWEDFLDAMSQTRLQDEYNKVVQAADIFVGLFHTKGGKYTAEEFEKALETFKANNKPMIYTYFKDEPVRPSELTRDGFISLDEFKQRLRALEHYPTVYQNTDNFLRHFSDQLPKIFKHWGIDI